MMRTEEAPARAPRGLSLSLALCLVSLSACGDGGGTPPSPPPSPWPTPFQAAGPADAGPPSVDRGIPAYQQTSGVSGTLSSVGSDTMNNLMTLWGEAFTRLYPAVRVQVEGKGSSTAPPALAAGAAQLGPMSREMKPSEVEAFEGRFGYPPTAVRTALDALAVYVHKDNPLDKLTLAQVDAVFSKSRRRGAPEVRTWGDLGLGGEWASRPVSAYGRNSASGTYGFFKEHVLRSGDFKDTVKEQPGSASVVQSVSEDPFGIGYSGIGYRTSGVKPLALAESAGGPYSQGRYRDVVGGTYPLSRHLFVYVNRPPGQRLDPLVGEFLRLVLSREGQEVVVKDGYLPLPADEAGAERSRLD